MLLITDTASASDGEVNISGKITANTCTVATSDLTVDMGKFDRRDFEEGRNASGIPAIPFVIALKDCNGIASGVQVGFFGNPDTYQPDIYALDEGGATGIGLKLLDNDKAKIPVNTWSKFYPLDGDSADIALRFYALYTADGSEVQAGQANTTVTFRLNYD
ncbi:fimbrial protein (plasmid) [Klebsiella aerogenes]